MASASSEGSRCSWAVSSFAVRVRTALGVIFRTGVPTLLAGRISGTGLGLLIVACLAAYASGIAWASHQVVPWWTRVLLGLAIAGIGLALALFVYWSLTPGEERPSVREHVPGAIALLLMGVALERLGALYVANVVARTTAIYGAIGAIFGLFAFLYLAMWAFLVGAESPRSFGSDEPRCFDTRNMRGRLVLSDKICPRRRGGHMSDRQPSAGAAGWAMFAGFVMIMVGCFHAIWGLGAIINDSLYNTPSDYFLKVNQSGWGWIHVIAGVIILFAGFGVFRGLVWARTVGVIMATLSAVAAFASLPYGQPIWNGLIIVIDVAIIWALTVHGRDITEMA